MCVTFLLMCLVAHLDLLPNLETLEQNDTLKHEDARFDTRGLSSTIEDESGKANSGIYAADFDINNQPNPQNRTS